MISRRGYVLPGGNAESETLLDGLGFGFKSLDPRRRLKRHLKRGLRIGKAGLRFATKTADPRSHLLMAKRGLDPLGLMKKKKRRRGKKWIWAAIAAKRRARGLPIPPGIATTLNAGPGFVMPVADTHAAQLFDYAIDGMGQGWGEGGHVVIPVGSDETIQTLGELGFKFPKIGRKLRKKIAKYAAIGAAAYFTGGAALTALKAKGGAGILGKVAGAGGKIAKKKLSARAKKKLKKLAAAAKQSGVLSTVKTAAEAQGLPPTPESVAAQSGGGGGGWYPSGGGALSPAYEVDPDTGEVTTGISSTPAPTQAGFGGGGVGTFLIVGGLIAAVMASGGRGRGRR